MVSAPVASDTTLRKPATSSAGAASRRSLLAAALAVCAGAWLAAPAAAQSDPVILVMGDSLSAEYGIARNRGWVALLTERLSARKFKWRVINASVSGETSSGGLSRLPALIEQHHPALVIIELGANDGLRGLPIAAMKSNLKRMVELARRHSARVLLVGIRVPPNYGRPYTEAFAKVYENLAAETRSAHAPFLLEGFADRSEWFQADGIHPNENAQAMMLDNVWTALEPMLTARR